MRSEQQGTVLRDWTWDAAGEWVLTEGTRTVARLKPGHRGWVGETGAAAWSLQRVGFHRPRVVVRPVGSLAEVAHAQPDWRGLHALSFVSGPTWELDPSHSGGTVVRDDSGAVVYRVSWNGRFDAPGARVVADATRAEGRFGPLAGIVAGHLVLDALGDPTRRLAFGVPLGATVRSRWS